MKNAKDRLYLSRELFWDVDFETIDYDKHRVWVIGRALNSGRLDEIIRVFEYYGMKEVKRCIVQTTELWKTQEIFWSEILQIPREKFLSFQSREACPVKGGPW